MKLVKTNARVALTKFVDTFLGDDGKEVHFEYCEIEFAPNCYCRFKLNNSNKRVLQKYNPDMFQLLSNIPFGTTVLFEELPLDSDPATSSELSDIYERQQNEL